MRCFIPIGKRGPVKKALKTYGINIMEQLSTFLIHKARVTLGVATAAFWDSVLIYSYSRSGTPHLRVLVLNGTSELGTCSYCQVVML